MAAAAAIVAKGSKVLPYWLIVTYMLHTFGELCLSPVGLSYYTKLAPKRFVGQMMGMWFLATSLGNLVASLIAGEFDANNVAAMPGQYMHIVYFSVGLGAVLLVLSRPGEETLGSAGLGDRLHRCRVDVDPERAVWPRKAWLAQLGSAHRLLRPGRSARCTIAASILS
jgi:MFS family permease